jgi:hypothetical protein
MCNRSCFPHGRHAVRTKAQILSATTQRPIPHQKRSTLRYLENVKELNYIFQYEGILVFLWSGIDLNLEDIFHIGISFLEVYCWACIS